MRFGMTSSIIETVATSILNLALANPRQASVRCTINSNTMDLIQGNLEEAKVDGSNWATPMGMTIRTIDLVLEGMKIKPQDVFRGKISFKCPAKGRALLSLDAADFGNFLVHPLLRVADLPSGQFRFLRQNTELDPGTGRTIFCGFWHDQPVVMEACQPERFGKIYVRVAEMGRLTPLGCKTLGREMTEFFNTVTLDLDGTQVSFSDMRTGYNHSGEERLRVTVDVTVHRLPNPDSLLF
ncbi:unnamed protein product [Discosporangium mesarthrocarpum]